MGECPDWYVVVRAARYLRVPPWELQKQPKVWTAWALAAEGAEMKAQEEQQKQAERKSKAASNRGGRR